MRTGVQGPALACSAKSVVDASNVIPTSEARREVINQCPWPCPPCPGPPWCSWPPQVICVGAPAVGTPIGFAASASFAEVAAVAPEAAVGSVAPRSGQPLLMSLATLQSTAAVVAAQGCDVPAMTPLVQVVATGVVVGVTVVLVSAWPLLATLGSQ